MSEIIHFQSFQTSIRNLKIPIDDFLVYLNYLSIMLIVKITNSNKTKKFLFKNM